MNIENNETNSFNSQQPPAPPQPDPRIEQLARDLQANWAQYKALEDAAYTLAQRPDMPSELMTVLKQTASKSLEENMEKTVKSFLAKPEPAGTTGSNTQQAAPQAADPKKLYRTDYDKMLAGVAGGLGEYLNIDSSIVRLFFVIASFVYLVGVIAYVVLAILLPVKVAQEEI